jgi:hypothetical protein
VAEVYWIHLQEHTEMFSQGYIGITKTTAKKRFYKHLSASKSNTTRAATILSRAINKYGDKIIVDTLVICDIDYAFDMETKLRPSPRIGWNTDQGGRGRKEVSEETRMKISKTLVGHKGVVHSDETKKRMSEKRLGVPRPEGMADKIRATLLSNGPWNKSNADEDVWLNAQNLYELFVGGLGYTAAANKLNLPVGKASTPFEWFNRGWVPSSDDNWLTWKLTKVNMENT